MPHPKRSTPKIMHRAGELRKELTPAERKLWSRLRNEQLNDVNFRRQHAIGNYIADFCAIKEKLIIELDGGQHAGDEAVRYDNERTKFFELLGYRVIRFWNNQVIKELENVILAIMEALDPHPPPPPSAPPPNTT